MRFGTWYQVNCGSEREWRDDFALMRDTGFEFMVLWHMLAPRSPMDSGGDVRGIVTGRGQTLRALEEAGRAGLVAHLGVWHPYNMGNVAPRHRLRWSSGRKLNAPDLFDRGWVRRSWLPYVRRAARSFGGHPAYGGLYLDDTFPSVAAHGPVYSSYSAAAEMRFRSWLAERHLTVGNLNMLLRPREAFSSFAAVRPPREPGENLALWAEWTEARASWCEEFMRETRAALRAVDPDPRHTLVMSDQDYHLRCNALQYGVDYRRLVRHLDAFEIYMAAQTSGLGRREVLADVRNDVRLGRAIAGGTSFQFHAWSVNREDFSPLRAGLLESIIECAAEEGADAVEVYTFKVRDWRVRGGRSIFPEISLRCRPGMLARLRRLFARLGN